MHSKPHLQHHPSLSLFLIGMLTGEKQDKPQQESVVFFSTSPKSINDTTLMDNYSTYISRQLK